MTGKPLWNKTKQSHGERRTSVDLLPELELEVELELELELELEVELELELEVKLEVEVELEMEVDVTSGKAHAEHGGESCACRAAGTETSRPSVDLAAHMPIEFVCKIKFAEEDEKRKGKQDGEEAGLLEEGAGPPTHTLARFAGSCSLHGMNHIFVSGRLGVRQALWALAVVLALALFLYQAAKSAMSYLEHPHVTALSEEASSEMVFPAVTICNINRFRFSALTDADIYHLANLTGLPPKNKDGHKPTDLEYPAPDMQDIFNRTGHQLDEMLKSCNFSGQNCSAEDFTVVSSGGGGVLLARVTLMVLCARRVIGSFEESSSEI
ncbi:hypothetical protein P4O66_002482 [Electrophorus voltai]|uniref:Acid-sensing ion channel 4 n=1 Tax=Electrophorus voltai TaxID=2609070 RepID=A0AAD9DQ62_9TELE|nr:hypothetical protein P4O66_002482 [Electrophorus voltai]